jgi:hypothetical protein
VASALILLAAAGAANGWVLFVAGPRSPGSESAYGTVETQAGLWLAHHREGRPCYLVRSIFWTLRAPRADMPFEQVNAHNFFRLATSMTAVRLVAGLYGAPQERAIDPRTRPRDVDLVRSPPLRVDRPSVILLPEGQVRRVVGRYRVSGREDVRDVRGRSLFTALEVDPLPAGRTLRRAAPP